MGLWALSKQVAEASALVEAIHRETDEPYLREDSLEEELRDTIEDAFAALDLAQERIADLRSRE